MTIEMTLAFAAAFFVLAVTPGPGMAAILSRALVDGMSAGLTVAAGLILGDAIFLAIAIVGLSAIAATLGPGFQIVKYAGAAYLIWLGIKTWRAAGAPLAVEGQTSVSRAKDFALGLFVTLGNPKPILFYGALLPTFMDIQAASVVDFFVLMAVVVLITFAVYGSYIAMIERARRAFASTRAVQRLNQATGVMMIGSGVVVATR